LYTANIITNWSYLTFAIVYIGWRLGIILTGRAFLAWARDYLKPSSLLILYVHLLIKICFSFCYSSEVNKIAHTNTY